jgi:hypothetical protein
MALLEIKILTKTHRDTTRAEERGGGAPATAGSGTVPGARFGRAVSAAFALIAGVTGLTWHGAVWGQTEVNPGTAAGVRWSGTAGEPIAGLNPTADLSTLPAEQYPMSLQRPFRPFQRIDLPPGIVPKNLAKPARPPGGKDAP